MEKTKETDATNKAPRRRSLLKRIFLPWSHTLLVVAILLCVGFIVAFSLDSAVTAMNGWPLWILIILSLVFSLLVVFVLYFALMAIYVRWKRRNPHHKYRAEVCLVIIGFVISVAFKFFALPLADGVEGVFQQLGRSIYASLGGLQFEGLPSDWAVGGCIGITMYYASSILAGLVFFSVIASQAFYEIYCRVLIYFTDTSDKDIYIFTALNEETLNIANSISKKNDSYKSSLIIFAGPALKPFDRHDPNCVEVMGHRYLYWSFNTKKDTEKAKKKPETILASIGLLSWMRQPANWNEVHVFAFDSDDDHIPNEEENMDYVFMGARNQLATMSNNKGVKARTAYCKKYYSAGTTAEEDAAFAKPYLFPEDKVDLTSLSEKERAEKLEKRRKREIKVDRRFGIPKQHVSYYILTKRRINYQAYQDKINELDEEFYTLFRQINLDCFNAYNKMCETKKAYELLKKDDESRYELFRQQKYKELVEARQALKAAEEKHFVSAKAFDASWQESKPFSIYVWNESDAIAKEAQLFMTEDDKTSVIPDQNDTWVRSYGFGPTGQSLARMLFSYSAAVNGNTGKASDFYCEVFDPEGKSKLAGLAQMEMPFSVVLTENDEPKEEQGDKTKPLSPEEKMLEEYKARRASLIEETYQSYLNYTTQSGAEKSDKCIWDAADGFVPRLYDDIARYNNDSLRKELSERRKALLSDGSYENNEVPVPLYYFHDYGIGNHLAPKSCGGIGTTDFMTPFSSEKRVPDYIIVAVGDDYQNIRIANDLTKILVDSADQTRLVTIFVNVWDEKNNNLILGFAKARKEAAAAQEKAKKETRKGDDADLSADAGQIIYFSKNIRLIIVGNNADIYQRAAIVPSNRSINYNDAYDNLQFKTHSAFNQTFSAESNLYFRALSKSKETSPKMYPFVLESGEIWKRALSLSENMDEKLSEGIIHTSLDGWRGLDIWRRRSSMEAQLFGFRYYMELKCWNSEKGDTIDSFVVGLARLEHQRWMRLHIADGWRYGASKNGMLQTHSSILPYPLMRWETGIYDLMNVYLGLAMGNVKDKNKAEAKETIEKLNLSSAN